LAADYWGTGLAGWNAKASGRSKSDGRRAKKHSSSGDSMSLPTRRARFQM
jgi:hypothetical protein